MRNHLFKYVRGTVVAWALLSGALSSQAQAQVPSSFSYFGEITKPDGTPLEASNVSIIIRVMSPGAEGCVLYDEQHTVDMTNSEGRFDIAIGKGTMSYSGHQNPTTALTLAQAFSNGGTFSGLTCASGTSYTPALNDSRKIHVLFNDNVSSGWVTISPDHVVHSVPYSQIAATLGGKSKSDFLQVNSSTAQLTQSNIESVFQTSGNVSELLNLINGTSTLYAKTSSSTSFTQAVTFAQAPTYSGSISSGTQLVNKNYCDSKIGGASADPTMTSLSAGDTGKVLQWDGSKWVAQTANATDNTKLPLSGGAMTGALTLPTDGLSVGSNQLAFGGGAITLTPSAGNSVIVNQGTTSTSPTSGALVVNGGVGIAENLNAGGSVTAQSYLTTMSPTLATAGSNSSSPPLYLKANYWTGSSSQLDAWAITNEVGAGANPPTALSFRHPTGSTGPRSYLFPEGKLAVGTATPGAQLDIQATDVSSPLLRVMAHPSNGNVGWVIDPYAVIRSQSGGIVMGYDANASSDAISSSTDLHLTSGFGTGSSTSILLKPSGPMGKVGIATDYPQATLHVAGQLLLTSPAGTIQDNASEFIDWNSGNTQTYTGTCATTITMSNMLDGGNYTLALTNATAPNTCSFSSSGLIFRFNPANALLQGGTVHRIYHFQRIHSVVYVRWEDYMP